MNIDTTRFGRLQISSEEQIRFPQGLIGFDGCRDWVLLGDKVNSDVHWLQSLNDPELALATVSPGQFVPNWHVSVSRDEIQSLRLEPAGRACLLAILSKHDNKLTLNLKAPLMINIDDRLGRQIITCGEQPLQLALPSVSVSFRKSA